MWKEKDEGGDDEEREEHIIIDPARAASYYKASFRRSLCPAGAIDRAGPKPKELLPVRVPAYGGLQAALFLSPSFRHFHVRHPTHTHTEKQKNNMK